MTATAAGFVLGIDIGTTTVKVCLVDASTRRTVHTLSRETKATLASDVGASGSEQDPHKICTALQFCVSRLPKESLQRIVEIGVSGQMHGVVLWTHGRGWHRNPFGRYEVGDASCLYTWQDGRCGRDFLASLPPPSTHLRIATGHGCATLFWLNAHRSDVLTRYDRAGTIQDYVVAMLCALPKPVMSIQNAASWGYFDTILGRWNVDVYVSFP